MISLWLQISIWNQFSFFPVYFFMCTFSRNVAIIGKIWNSVYKYALASKYKFSSATLRESGNWKGPGGIGVSIPIFHAPSAMWCFFFPHVSPWIHHTGKIHNQRKRINKTLDLTAPLLLSFSSADITFMFTFFQTWPSFYPNKISQCLNQKTNLSWLSGMQTLMSVRTVSQTLACRLQTPEVTWGTSDENAPYLTVVEIRRCLMPGVGNWREFK